MALSSYSNFIIKLNENIVNTNVRKLYGSSLRYVRLRKSDFQPIFLCAMNNVTIYGSTDNFLSPVLISDWLIFCCGNSILHQKRICWKKFCWKFRWNEIICQEIICRYKVAFFTMNSPHWPWHVTTCSKL